MQRLGLPKWLRGKEFTCQRRRCRRGGFDPRVRTTPWRRKWQPTPVFLPGESHGWRSLVGYHPWGRTESDTTEGLGTAHNSVISDAEHLFTSLLAIHISLEKCLSKPSAHFKISCLVLLMLFNLFVLMSNTIPVYSLITVYPLIWTVGLFLCFVCHE